MFDSVLLDLQELRTQDVYQHLPAILPKPPDLLQRVVLRRLQHAAHALKVARAGLELARRVFGRGAYLVSRQAVQQVILAIQDSHVRTEKFVL